MVAKLRKGRRAPTSWEIKAMAKTALKTISQKKSSMAIKQVRITPYPCHPKKCLSFVSAARNVLIRHAGSMCCAVLSDNMKSC